MKNVANSRFAIKSWDEKPFSEGQDLPRMTRAAVTNRSPMSWSLAPGRGSFGPCAAKARRPWGTGLSILSR